MYNKAIENKKKTILNNIKVGISAIIVKETLPYLTHIIDLAVQFGLPSVSFQPFQSETARIMEDHSRFLFKKHERKIVNEKLKQLEEYTCKKNIQILTKSILKNISFYFFEDIKPIPKFGCNSPSTFILVYLIGYYYLCFFMKERALGNAYNMTIGEMWHTEMHNRYQSVALTKKCTGFLANCSDIKSFNDVDELT